MYNDMYTVYKYYIETVTNIVLFTCIYLRNIEIKHSECRYPFQFHLEWVLVRQEKIVLTIIIKVQSIYIQ